MKAFRASTSLAIFAASSMFFTGSLQAQQAEYFYAGKTIAIIVGFGVGGAYDFYARLLAQHMSKHIPGNP